MSMDESVGAAEADAVEIDAVEIDAVEIDVIEGGNEDVDGDEVEDVLLLEEVDQELVLAVWEPTGEPRVGAALDLLTTLDPDDVHQHAAVFDDIHQQLRATLTDLDTATS